MLKSLPVQNGDEWRRIVKAGAGLEEIRRIYPRKYNKKYR